jgi:hypothetical protein
MCDYFPHLELVTPISIAQNSEGMVPKYGAMDVKLIVVPTLWNHPICVDNGLFHLGGEDKMFSVFNGGYKLHNNNAPVAQGTVCIDLPSSVTALLL